jgi:long-chain acyl-CoA synthetase
MVLGSRIGLLGENRPEWAIGYLAAVSQGIVVVPLDPQLKPEGHRHILHDSASSACITTAQYLGRILELKPALPDLSRIICMDIIADRPSGVEFLDDLEGIGGDSAAIPHRGPGLKDVAAIIYTSGTTGQAKAVVLTHRNLMSDVDAQYRSILYDERDNFLSVLPLHHTFESTCGLLVPLYNGATVTYARSLKSRDIVEDIRDSRTTVLLGVPLLFEKMLAGIYRAVSERGLATRLLFWTLHGFSRTLRTSTGLKGGREFFGAFRRKAGLSTLRLMISGGAPLAQSVARDFETLGFPLLQGYGLTESGPVLCLNPPARPRNETVGPPLPTVEIRILEADRNGIGEVLARGPMIMQGYYRNPAATGEVLRDGWLHTGDLGCIESDGYLRIVGRRKNVIVTAAGKNVYPEEVEAALLKSPYISEILVLGITKPNTNHEEVHALIFPNYEELDRYGNRGGRRLDNEGVEDLIRQEIRRVSAELPDFKRVKGFEIRSEEFPKTTTRKIKRYLFDPRRTGPGQGRKNP